MYTVTAYYATIETWRKKKCIQEVSTLFAKETVALAFATTATNRFW